MTTVSATFSAQVPCLSRGQFMRVDAGPDPWENNRPVVTIRAIETKHVGLQHTPRLTPANAALFADHVRDAIAFLETIQETP